MHREINIDTTGLLTAIVSIIKISLLYTARVLAMAEIEGEKKYSPPRDWTKSVDRVIVLV